MKNLKNKKGFTLVELLAVIVVLAIVMGLAVVGITSVLDSTRKSAFAADAKSYIEGAHALVRADEATVLMGGTGTYTPPCSKDYIKPDPEHNVTGYQGNDNIKDITIPNIKLDSGGKSPYGSEYSTSSFVRVYSWYQGGNCFYEYAVYLTDGTFSIGTDTNPVAEKSVNSNSVN